MWNTKRGEEKGRLCFLSVDALLKIAEEIQAVRSGEVALACSCASIEAYAED